MGGDHHKFRFKHGQNSCKLRIFSGSSNPELAAAVAEKSGLALGNVTLRKFSNNEIDVLLKENVRGQNVFIIQTAGAGDPNNHLVELLLLANACRLADAATISAVLPLYFYSASDSKDCYRVSVAGKLVASMMKKAGIDHVMILDPHTSQLEGFFDMPADSLRVEPVVTQWIRKNIDRYEECVIASPFEEGIRRVMMVADDLNVDYTLVSSRIKQLGGLNRGGTFWHARLNHQHLSDRWRMIAEDEEPSNLGSEELPDEDDDGIVFDPEPVGNRGKDEVELPEPLAGDNNPAASDTTAAADWTDVSGLSSNKSSVSGLPVGLGQGHLSQNNRASRLSVKRTSMLLRSCDIQPDEVTNKSPIKRDANHRGRRQREENEERDLVEARVCGDVEGKRVILFTDMIDTGRQLMVAAKALYEAGAASLHIIATHGVFSPEAFGTICSFKPEFVKGFTVTNSIPQTVSKDILGDRLSIMDISGLISEVIRRHHFCESVSVVSGMFLPTDFEDNLEEDEEQAGAQGTSQDSQMGQIGSLGVMVGKRREGLNGSNGESGPTASHSPEGTNGSVSGRLETPANRRAGFCRKGFRLSSVCWD